MASFLFIRCIWFDQFKNIAWCTQLDGCTLLLSPWTRLGRLYSVRSRHLRSPSPTTLITLWVEQGRPWLRQLHVVKANKLYKLLWANKIIPLCFDMVLTISTESSAAYPLLRVHAFFICLCTDRLSDSTNSRSWCSHRTLSPLCLINYLKNCSGTLSLAIAETLLLKFLFRTEAQSSEQKGQTNTTS